MVGSLREMGTKNATNEKFGRGGDVGLDFLLFSVRVRVLVRPLYQMNGYI